MSEPVLRIDAHMHWWTIQRHDYGWLTPELTALYRAFGPTEADPLLAAHRERNARGTSIKKWEECRGVGRSFGLNRLEGEKETIAPGALVHLLIDIVSKNGNLLLDVGPEPDGTIPAIQVDRLHQLGDWLRQNGEAIFATHPWIRSEGKTAEGIDVRFTRNRDTLYAILLGKPTGNSVVLQDVPATQHSHATLLGIPGPLVVMARGNNLKITLPATLPGQYAWAIKLQ